MMQMKSNADAYTTTPSGGCVSKRQRYGWEDQGEKGVFQWVDKNKLHIPVESYQRETTSEGKVRDMAAKWDWRAFGAISVVKRKNGIYSVFDGGHRTRAAMKRDDVKLLPCMVFDQSSCNSKENVKQEARSFISKNTKKSNVSAYDMHRAGVVAEDKVDIGASELLEKIGYKVKKDASSRFGIAAIGTVKNLVRKDPEMADYIMIKLAELADGAPIPAMVMRGFSYLYDKGIDFEEPAIKRKLKNTDIDSLVTMINREKHIMNQGGERIEAKAVLDYINKNRRKKLKLEL